MANRQNVLLVGIGGITCSFKSTLAKNVQRLVHEQHPDVPVVIVHQDEYYLPDDQAPPAPDVGHYNYETPEAMRLDDCVHSVQALIDRYAQSQQSTGTDSKAIIIMEGIMLYCHEPLRNLFDQRYFLFGNYEDCKRIRATRTDYVPADVEGYFDAYVWPYAMRYEKEARALAANMSFQFLPMQAYETNLATIMLGVRKWLDWDWLLLTKSELDLNQIVRFVTEPSDGAVSVFCGVTRDTFEGRKVIHLEYEAYDSMAYAEMQKLCTLLRSKWQEIDRIAIHHRLGVVPVTESSVIIAVSAPHRNEAQAACAFAIDHLKARVPIWKKEIYSDGSGTWKANSECCQHNDGV